MLIKHNIKSLCLEEEKQHAIITGHWDKEQSRIKQTGEVFTPTALVLEMLEQLPDEMWEDGRTFLEPSCGNGQFLAAIVIIKQALGHKQVLESVYGVDLMPDNVAECKARLLDIVGDTEQNRAILEQHILCRDGLAYDYSFGTSPVESLFEWQNIV